MKELTLNILKKNRVYFKCLNEKGYEVKLKIDELSKDLPLGTQTLLLNDISVTTKYGTDYTYELAHDSKKSESNKIVTLKHHMYNATLVEQCRNLAGKWDSSTNTWVFNAVVEDKVEELDYLYNSDIVNVELTAKDELFFWNRAIDFLGYKLAIATGRDSGAKVCTDIIMTAGKVSSAGSVKNWGTECTEGTKFIIKISRKLLENYDEERWEIKIID